MSHVSLPKTTCALYLLFKYFPEFAWFVLDQPWCCYWSPRWPCSGWKVHTGCSRERCTSARSWQTCPRWCDCVERQQTTSRTFVPRSQCLMWTHFETQPATSAPRLTGTLRWCRSSCRCSRGSFRPAPRSPGWGGGLRPPSPVCPLCCSLCRRCGRISAWAAPGSLALRPSLLGTGPKVGAHTVHKSYSSGGEREGDMETWLVTVKWEARGSLCPDTEGEAPPWAWQSGSWPQTALLLLRYLKGEWGKRSFTAVIKWSAQPDSSEFSASSFCSFLAANLLNDSEEGGSEANLANTDTLTTLTG